MPQLSTTSIFLIYLWTWFVLFLIMEKTAVLIKNIPTDTPNSMPKKPTLMLPWT
uniref:ATP synthase F0 subunit 8 n=1 Tax=Laticauda colubrina TaxID=8628 RepID=A0A343JZH4_LATCO|nr:ATP synthase F0 subunit 8 [Laticauda colubrina]ASZ83525.1 ATP synthase F0 subunit 8 [Laticauda colubrina]